MKSKIYIIPGLGENCSLIRYKTLGETLKSKGYNVVYINPNWYKTLSEQVFFVGKNSIICGFSFGGVLAYLIAKKYFPNQFEVIVADRKEAQCEYTSQAG